MPSLREVLGAQEGSGPGALPAPEGRPVEAVLLSRNDDTRLLLRGLLRLHHHRIVLEARTVDELRELAPGLGPRLLLQDVDTEDERWSDELAVVLHDHPDLRAVVLLPSEGGGLRAEAMRVGARAVIVRPFAIRELMRLVEEAVSSPDPVGHPPVVRQR